MLWTALTLALGAAVSLGLARFSYAMLLPPMRSDLGWTYFVAGAMNALNALGYMVGAWASPRWMRRWGVHSTLVGGGSVAAVALALHGLTQDTLLLAGLRGLTGMASAAMFVAGGLNDPRVMYWEPAKWVARHRALRTDDRLLVLRTEMGAGHGGPSGRQDAWREEAEVLSFFVDQLQTRR